MGVGSILRYRLQRCAGQSWPVEESWLAAAEGWQQCAGVGYLAGGEQVSHGGPGSGQSSATQGHPGGGRGQYG